ncbi:PadR-like family transcription regulator protein [Herbaspirillum seropedicae SmR1]|uniref:PadR-like family transcription regulator protein n=1 Tax=Herbaspirillum seropedicae (strain SmR1) TaxID=757424 RepID=D8IQJ7_HERSS|nr:PadR-like family transcription regulator protein [Herbaspirillum seropedicae SmR1]
MTARTMAAACSTTMSSAVRARIMVTTAPAAARAAVAVRACSSRGALRIVMLHLLQEKPRHGYDMIKAIEQLVGGGYSPSPGVIYPTLTLLEEMGYASVQGEDGGKKLYTLSPEGQAHLEEKDNVAALQQVLRKFELRRQERPDADSPELQRAVQNFRMALHTRLAKGKLAREELHAIIDIIDRAAVAVERV